MRPLALQDIRQAVGGKLMTPGGTTLPATSVCIDSRRIEPGCLFVAIRGENHDGHRFLQAAAAGGAIAAIVQDFPAESLPNVSFIQVDDTRKAFGQLATYVRQQMTSKVIAVAGSNGKTSTKHLVHAALSGKLNGSISPKSFNNDIGVPLTIFPADANQDYLVLEMGTNHPGEIKVLTAMAQPDIAIITNVGAEHLEFLGDLMGVRRENATIIDGLNPKGLLVVNGDDADLLSAVANYPGKIITFGFNETNDLFASNIECSDDGVRFNLNNSRRTVFVPMLGRHTASNALAAIAVARRMGVSEDQIIASLAEATGPEMRLQRQHLSGVTIVNDAYNANPNSMRAALETITTLSTPSTSGRRIAILGDMRELGESTDRYHREIGQCAAECDLDLLYCVGEKAALIADAAESAGMTKAKVIHFANASEASKIIPKWVQPGDLVLLKASRGIRLEAVAEAIVVELNPPDAVVARKVAS